MYLKFNRGVHIFSDVDLSNTFLLSSEVYIFYEVEPSCRYFLLFLTYFIGCSKGSERSPNKLLVFLKYNNNFHAYEFRTKRKYIILLIYTRQIV